MTATTFDQKKEIDASSMTRESERVAELDGLRGAAVMMVLAWHFIGSMSDQKSWISELAYAATIFGRTGVDLFFVLSGFLIVGILADRRDSSNVVRVFYWRRFLRIYPPYFMLILLYWISYGITGESAGFNTDGGVILQLFAQVTFNWNLLMAVVSGAVARGFSVTWSVAIEEWFYLLFPWVVFYVAPARLPKILLIIAVTSWALRAGFYAVAPQFPLAPYVLMPFRLDGLCVGGLLALAMRSRDALAVIERNKKTISIAALLFVSSLPIVIAAIRKNLDFHMYGWGHVYLSIGYSIVLIWVMDNRGKNSTRILRWRPLIHAGLYSYSLYLFHPLFISLYFQLWGKREVVDSIQSGLVAASALITAVFLSAVLYWTVERHLQALGHQSKYARGRNL